MEELLKYTCLWMWGNNLTLKFPTLVMDDFIALIFHDHVMHDHTSSHDLPHHLCALYPREWQTIAHLDWSTPNAPSTSFLHAYHLLANLLVFSSIG
jgi:hypothetical protein